MSYTLFDRMCDDVDLKLREDFDCAEIQAMWEEDIDPILDQFSDAIDAAWFSIADVIAARLAAKGGEQA